MATFTDDMSEIDKIKLVKNEIISMVKTQLGPLYLEEDEQVITNLSILVVQEALDICNMQETANNLVLIEAISIQAIIIAYQNRGVEGLASQDELGQDNEYISWIDYLRNNLIKSGKRFIQWELWD